jgi:hypothetical protein
VITSDDVIVGMERVKAACKEHSVTIGSYLNAALMFAVGAEQRRNGHSCSPYQLGYSVNLRPFVGTSKRKNEEGRSDRGTKLKEKKQSRKGIDQSKEETILTVSSSSRARGCGSH